MFVGVGFFLMKTYSAFLPGLLSVEKVGKERSGEERHILKFSLPTGQSQLD